MKRAGAPKNLTAQVAEALALKILDGGYQPSHTMPTEEELVRLTGVSRTTLRAAVQSLAAKGLLDVAPSRGTRVQAKENWNLLDADVIGWKLQLGVTAELVQAIYEMRECFEPRASSLAAQRGSEAGHARMLQAFQALRDSRPKGEEVAADADVEFHLSILANSGNDFIVSFGATMRAVLRTSFSIARKRRRLSLVDIEQHKAIMDAILDGDADAAEAATKRLLASSKRVQIAAATDAERSTRVSKTLAARLADA